MASRNSPTDDESFYYSVTDTTFLKKNDAPRSIASSFRRHTSTVPVQRVDDAAIPLRHTDNKPNVSPDTIDANPRERKNLVSDISTDEEGYVYMERIEDSKEPVLKPLTEITNLDKYGNTKHQLKTIEIREKKTNLQTRQTTTLQSPEKQAKFVCEGSETIRSESYTPAKSGRQILIRGVPDKLSTKDIARRLEKDIIDFENVFKELRVDRANREAIITLKNTTAVDNLLCSTTSGETFTLGDNKVEILPYNQPPIDGTKVFLSNLAHDMTAEDIRRYVKGILPDRPYSVIIGESPGTSLICLENSADTMMLLGRLGHYRCSKDRMWHASAIEHTRTLKVKVTGGKTTVEALRVYFEQTKHLEGELAVSIIYRSDFDDYVVTFANHEDAEYVLKRTNHTFNDVTLDVSVYPPCLDPSEEFLTRVPSPKKMHDLDPYKGRFLLKSPRYREQLECTVQRHFGRIIWPTENRYDFLQISCDVEENDRAAKDKIRDWSKNTAVAVCESFKMLRVQYKYYAIEVLEHLKAEIKEMEVSDPEAIKVFLEYNRVVIVGEEKCVGNIAKKVECIIQEMESSLDSFGKSITKILNVKSHEAELIQVTRCLEQFKHVNIGVNLPRICFNGKKQVVDEALSKVKETVEGLTKQIIEEKTKLELQLFQAERARMYIKERLKSAKITGVLELTTDGTLVLHSVTQEELKKAANVLNSSLCSASLAVKSSFGYEGKQFVANLERDYSGVLTIEICKDTLNFVSLDKFHEEIKEKVQHYIDSQLNFTVNVQIDPGVFRYVLVYKKHDIYDTVQRHESHNIEIDIVDKPYRKGFMISGEKEKCKLVIFELNSIVSSVVRWDHFITSDRAEKISKTMESKDKIKPIVLAEKCVLILTAPRPLVSDSQKCSSFAASCKIGQSEIKVVEDDITKTDVNFIVCPSYSTLEFRQGLGGYLVEKGGFRIKKDCKKHIELVKTLKAGDAFVGTAGMLSCKGIIHMILSTWNEGCDNEETILSQAIYKCLKEADGLEALSIAFPPVGIGQFGYPKGKVAKILIREIKEYLIENSTSTFLRQVLVCDLKGNMKQLLVQEIQEGFGQVTVKTSESSKENIANSNQQRITEGFTSEIKTEIIKGSVVSKATDVIVNSTNSNLDLRAGKLSKVLLEEGGPNIEAEYYKKYPDGICLGQLAETTGGLLKCKAIFHGILVPWNEEQNTAEAILRNFLRDCLITASKRHYASLSFPILETRVLQFPPHVVADALFDTIRDFEKEFPNSSMKTVQIVMRPDDKESVNAFEEHELYNNSPGKRSKIARVSMRQISQLSNVFVDIGVTFTTTIDHVTLRIEFGDLTKSTASVIVNSVGPGDFTLDSGIISKAILKGGGTSIQREANDKKKSFREEGIVMTNAGHLLCQKIIHVKAKNNVADWKKVVIRCLEECEKAEFNSISFPALGTGGKHLPASQMARAMIDGFKEYIRGERFKGELKCINIVVYEEDVLKCFTKEAKKAHESSSRKTIWERIKDTISATEEIEEDHPILHIYSESINTAARVLKRLKELHKRVDIPVTKAGVESLSRSENI